MQRALDEAEATQKKLYLGVIGVLRASVVLQALVLQMLLLCLRHQLQLLLTLELQLQNVERTHQAQYHLQGCTKPMWQTECPR